MTDLENGMRWRVMVELIGARWSRRCRAREWQHRNSPGKSVYFCTLADPLGRLARAERGGRLHERIPILCSRSAPHRRRDRLPAVPGAAICSSSFAQNDAESGIVRLVSEAAAAAAKRRL
jgi:hypothetical protein